MSEYVKKEDVLLLTECELSDDGFESFVIYPSDVARLPAADVVEVVRCKDCEHCSLLIDKRPLCLAGRAWMPITENDFCVWGKKRADNG